FLEIEGSKLPSLAAPGRKGDTAPNLDSMVVEKLDDSVQCGFIRELLVPVDLQVNLVEFDLGHGSVEFPLEPLGVGKRPCRVHHDVDGGLEVLVIALRGSLFRPGPQKGHKGQ